MTLCAINDQSAVQQFGEPTGALIATTKVSRADEDGVSFWIPGFFGGLAAT
jgi:hypothetical protein